MYPESFKNLGQVLKQTRAKLMPSDQQLHLCWGGLVGQKLLLLGDIS